MICEAKNHAMRKRIAYNIQTILRLAFSILSICLVSFSKSCLKPNAQINGVTINKLTAIATIVVYGRIILFPMGV